MTTSSSLPFTRGTRREEEEKRKTHHEGLRDVRRGGAIGLVLVRVADLERVDDGREPVDELVEVHARRVFARGRRPVVLGEPEKVVELGVDQGHDARRGARLRFVEGRRGCEANRAPTLGGARGSFCVSVNVRKERVDCCARESTHRRAVRERSSSLQAISKCSRLVMICATWESVDVLVKLPP